MTVLSDLLGGLFGTGAEFFLSQQDYDRLENLSDEFGTNLSGLANTARTNTQFTPFSITGTGGGASATGDGGTFTGLNVNLDPITQQLVNQGRMDSLAAQGAAGQPISAPQFSGGGFLAPGAPSLPSLPGISTPQLGLPTAPGYTGGIQLPGQISTNLQQSGLFNAPVQQAGFTQGDIAGGLQGRTTAANILGDIGAGTGRSEADIFSMLEGIQTPGRERERLLLRDELSGQGRLGLQTAAFGGSPEELARAKAVEEARSSNAFRAFQLAGEEQGRLAQQALQAHGIGETSAGRVDQALLESFGLGDRSRQTAQNLTQILGGLGLQGQELGDRFQLGLLDAALGQRGQDVQGALGAGDIANRFNLGLFGQQSQNVLEGGRVQLMADELRQRGQGQAADQLLQQFDIASRNAIEGGRQSLMADELQLGLFGEQGRQQLNQAQIASQLYRDTFLPEQSLLDQLGLGADIFEIAQRGDIQGEQIAQNADLNRIEGLLNLETTLAGLKSDQSGMLADLLLGTVNEEVGGVQGGALDWLFDTIFGGSGQTYQGPGGT